MKIGGVNLGKVAILTLLMFSACDDQLNEPLENQPLNRATSEEVQLDLLLGSYSSLHDLQWPIHPTIGLRGDDVNSGPEDDQPLMLAMNAYSYDENAWFFNNVWNDLYNDITSDFWSSIEEIEKINSELGDTEAGNQYIAEIKVMIGFEMLHLTRLWGDILVPTSSSPDAFAELPVSTREEALQFISELMDEAIPFLPTVRPNQRTDIQGGITAYTALAVKAMANLDLENWNEAASATAEIINSGLFSLYPDFYELFNKPGELSDEMILEFQYSDFGTAANATGEFNHLFNFYGPPGAGWYPAVEGVANGWGFWEPTQKYVEFMLDRNDLIRLEKTVHFTPNGVARIEASGYTDLPDFTTISQIEGEDVVLTKSGDGFGNNVRVDFHSGKHILPSTQISGGVTRFNSGKNFTVIRYAEVLLMHAEAVVSGGSNSSISAEEAVNLVRERAGLDPLGSVDLQAVLDEKYAELAAEWGIRFADVVRHGITDELNEGGRTYNPGEDRFIPYPVTQVDLLPQLDR